MKTCILLLMLFVSFLLFSESSAQSSNKTSIIAGKVVDAATDEPLIGANVYLSNTTLGMAADVNGEYNIRKIPYGTYEVICSYIGYDPIKMKMTFNDEYYSKVFELKINSELIEEVVVIGDNKEWKNNYKIFEREFLGTSKNASKTVIINPHILNFENVDGQLTATANGFLEVENKALGYFIILTLNNFEYQDDIMRISYSPFYTKLKSVDAKELGRWKKNRERAYKGSIEHLLSLLYEYQPTDPEEGKPSKPEYINAGFDLAFTKYVNFSGYEYSDRIKMNELIFDNNSGYEKTLRADQLILIMYHKEMQELNYVKFLSKSLNSLTDKSSEGYLDRPLETQQSIIQLNYDELSFNKYGVINNNADDFLLYGYMGWERLADDMPFDYRPEAEQGEEKTVVEENVVTKLDIPKAPLVNYSNDQLSALNKLNSIEQELIKQNNIDKYDPELAVEYITLAVENEIVSHYEKATEFYLENISKADPKDKTFATEAEILSYVVPGNDDNNSGNKSFKKMLSKKKPNLTPEHGRFIKDYWMKVDIDPTTKVNERLIEHFERIIYARKTFNKNRNSVLGSDDRGLIYLKHGKPQMEKTGNLGTNTGELFQKIGLVLDILTFHQTRFCKCGGSSGMSSQFASNKISQIANHIRSLDPQPEFEVWFYQFDESKEPIYYLFGHEDGSGAFRLKNSVEEFIASKMFTASRRFIISSDNGEPHSEEMLPGSFLQIMYYSQLSMLSSEFGRKYRDLESYWRGGMGGTGLSGPSAMRGQQTQNLDAGKTNTLINSYEPPRSKYEEIIKPIDISAQQFRFLRNNVPKLGIMMTSFPGGLTLEDITSTATLDEAASKIKVQHSLIINDFDWNEVDKLSHSPGNEHISFFSYEHKDAGYKYVVTARETKETQFTVDELYAKGEKIQSGKEILNNIDPLYSGQDKLELSDMIIGYNTGDVLEYEDIKLKLAPTNRFIMNDNISLYLEIYNLFLNPDELAKYSIVYNIAPAKEKNVIKKLFSGKGKNLSQTLNYDSQERNVREHLELDISTLDKGEYMLGVTVKDLNSGFEKNRMAEFEIVKPKQKSFKK